MHTISKITVSFLLILNAVTTNATKLNGINYANVKSATTMVVASGVNFEIKGK